MLSIIMSYNISNLNSKTNSKMYQRRKKKSKNQKKYKVNKFSILNLETTWKNIYLNIVYNQLA